MSMGWSAVIAPGIINSERKKMATCTFFLCGMSHLENAANDPFIFRALAFAFSSDV
jgi:hypothetical protein